GDCHAGLAGRRVAGTGPAECPGGNQLSPVSRRPGRPAAPHRRYRRSPAGLPARTEPGHPGTGAAISGAPARTSGGAGRPFVGVNRCCRAPLSIPLPAARPTVTTRHEEEAEG